MAEFCIYTAPGCTLCAEAETRFYAAANVRLQQVDVSQSLDLKKRYGLRIPVLAHVDSGSELAWPFDAEQIARWIGQVGQSL